MNALLSLKSLQVDGTQLSRLRVLIVGERITMDNEQSY
jgi:hypothetical protein